MSKTQNNAARNNEHGELTDDELDQVTGGEIKLLYDIKVSGMRINAWYDTETGDSRTCVTGAGCRVTTGD